MPVCIAACVEFIASWNYNLLFLDEKKGYVWFSSLVLLVLIDFRRISLVWLCSSPFLSTVYRLELYYNSCNSVFVYDAVSHHTFQRFSTGVSWKFLSSWKHLFLSWTSFYISWEGRMAEQVQNSGFVLSFLLLELVVSHFLLCLSSIWKQDIVIINKTIKKKLNCHGTL